MTHIEALNLALDLATMHHTDAGYAELRAKVRVAIKEAHPQQESVAREPNDAELLKAFTRSNNGPNPFYRCNTCGDTEPGVREYLSNHWLKHNNTSPPQRTWAGLTDEEALECWPGLAMYADCVKFWENIEAKLKEKNEH
jgi:hypothetical protein